MWNAASGRRTFSGRFGRLLATGIVDLVDKILESVERGDKIALNVPPFDRLTAGRKIFLLRLVALGLFEAETPAPDLTAASEGTVDAIFRRIEFLLECEIDQAEDGKADFVWRALIKDALDEERSWEAENSAELVVKPLDVKSNDWDEWLDALDELSAQILADTDYLCAAALDVPEEHRGAFARSIGVVDDYFWRVYDNPKPRETRQIAEEIRKLCGEIIAKN